VREEHDRFERLEEQLNDLTELHQHEVENIKSGVRDMEEKVLIKLILKFFFFLISTLKGSISCLFHENRKRSFWEIWFACSPFLYFLS
jgi:hypothetical protein